MNFLHSERSALRHRAHLQRAQVAHALMKKEPQMIVTVFLMADLVVAAKAGQKTPDGYYNVERMLKRVLAGNGTYCCAEPAWTHAP